MAPNSEDLPAILGGKAVRSQGPPDWPGDDPAVAAALERAVRERTWGAYHGPRCEELAERLAEYHDCRHAVLCSSGTAAVELALRGLKVGPGDEVVLAAYDFKGNFQNVLAVGAQPVLTDVAPHNWNLDPQGLADALTESTAAVIVSHLHGGAVPMKAVMELASRHGVAVVEDACQMPGATIEGRPAGTWGDVGILSFGGSKLLSAGRGGAVLTDDPAVVQRARLYSHRGNEAYPLSELQATVLLPQMNQLDAANEHRQKSVEYLHRLLEEKPGICPFAQPGPETQTKPGYYKVGLQYEAEAFDGLGRDLFCQAMRAEGIALDPGFRALHRIHSRRRFRSVGGLPNATDADERVVVLHHPILLSTDLTNAAAPFAASAPPPVGERTNGRERFGGDQDLDQIAAAIDKVASAARRIADSIDRR